MAIKNIFNILIQQKKNLIINIYKLLKYMQPTLGLYGTYEWLPLFAPKPFSFLDAYTLDTTYYI